MCLPLSCLQSKIDHKSIYINRLCDSRFILSALLTGLLQLKRIGLSDIRFRRYVTFLEQKICIHNLPMLLVKQWLRLPVCIFREKQDHMVRDDKQTLWSEAAYWNKRLTWEFHASCLQHYCDTNVQKLECSYNV